MPSDADRIAILAKALREIRDECHQAVDSGDPWESLDSIDTIREIAEDAIRDASDG